MEIFGSVHVWISSEEIANDLLSKRGTIYSDRPTIPNLPDNRTSGDYLALLGRTGKHSFSSMRSGLRNNTYELQKHGSDNAKSHIRSCLAQQLSLCTITHLSNVSVSSTR